jgi:hypothetical protein
MLCAEEATRLRTIMRDGRGVNDGRDGEETWPHDQMVPVLTTFDDEEADYGAVHWPAPASQPVTQPKLSATRSPRTLHNLERTNVVGCGCSLGRDCDR